MPKIKTLTQLRSRLAQIAESPHETTGRWTAAQIFYHLAAAFEGSVEGLPPGYNVVARILLAPMRWMLTRVWFPAGIPIPAAIADKVAPPPEADLAEQYQRLLTAIEQFERHEGPHPPHPVLGYFSHEEWVGFHLRHSEHHLRFIREQESL